MHIRVFDFDNTICKVPNYTSSEADGMMPYEWFNDPTSLSDKMNVCGVENVIEQTKMDDSVNILISKREMGCKSEVEEIVKKLGCRFDEMHFIHRDDNKGETLREILHRNQQVESITIYEDDLYEIIDYVDHLEDYSAAVRIDFVYVDCKKVIGLDWPTAFGIRNFAEVERLRITKPIKTL